MAIHTTKRTWCRADRSTYEGERYMLMVMPIIAHQSLLEKHATWMV